MSDSAPGVDVFLNSFYIGINIENILYGIELALYFKTMHTILFSRRTRKKSDKFYILFSTIILLLITVWVATQAVFGEKMWILNPNFPGGPDGYWQAHIADWYMDCGTTAIVLLQLMTDALMIHRCRVIWGSYYAIVIPIILWIATLALGFMMDWTSSQPGSDFFTGIAAQLGLAYWSVSVFLNTTLSCMICYRMMRHGKWVRDHLGQEHAALYFTAATIIIESVLPYTISGIAYLVSEGIGSPTSVAFVSVYVLLMCISPQMLILRVISGRTWVNAAPVSQVTTLQFKFAGKSESSRFDSTGPSANSQTLSNVYLPDGHDKV